MPAEATAGTSRAKRKQVAQLGESPAMTAGTMQAAIPETAIRTGELGLIMDPRAMPTMTKAGTHKARIAIVLREEMRIMAKAGTSRAHTGIVLSREVRTRAKTGTNKAQLTIALMEGTLGAGLQDPSQPLTTPGPQATSVVAGAAIQTTTILRATCQALGTIIQGPNLEIQADPSSLPKVGTAMATLPLPAMAHMGGATPLDPQDHHFPARVVIKAGEEGATEVGIRRAIGTREVQAQAQEQNGTMTHPTTLDRPPTRGGLTLLGTPKVRQRIGSGSTGVGLGILRVIGMVTGGD
jgi:hypothetical protein